MTELDLVVRGDLVLPDRVLRDGALGILDGRFATVSHPADAAPDAAETLDVGDALVLPGLVDTHVHCLSSPRRASRGPPRRRAPVALRRLWTCRTTPARLCST